MVYEIKVVFSSCCDDEPDLFLIDQIEPDDWSCADSWVDICYSVTSLISRLEDSLSRSHPEGHSYYLREVYSRLLEDV